MEKVVWGFTEHALVRHSKHSKHSMRNCLCGELAGAGVAIAIGHERSLEIVQT